MELFGKAAYKKEIFDIHKIDADIVVNIECSCRYSE